MVGRNIQGHPAATNWDIQAPSSQELDLTDSASVEAYIDLHQPELIVHTAGMVGGISANIAEPVTFLDKNVTIGRNVIMGARNAGVRHLINLASTCIYPRNAKNPLFEDMILQGELEPTNEGYALAKILALRLCEYIRREDQSFFYKTLIPCNLFGAYDKFDPDKSHLVPAIIHKIHEAKVSGTSTVDIWGDGTARREFMFASDLAEAVYRAADDIERIPDSMNIGMGHDHTINDYYNAVAKVIDWTGEFKHDLNKPVGMNRKLCDITRQTDWGWSPKTSLENGIAKTYQYYLGTLKL